MKLLACPRDRNPYQGELYGRMSELGWSVRYLHGPTPSVSVNLLLVPLMLLWHRLSGFRILHVHWVFGFVPAWAGRWGFVRRACRGWFLLVLAVARALGYRIVWTAHNVLPHRPVFDDDDQARRALARACSVIIVHNGAAAQEVRQRFEPAGDVVVVPHGVRQVSERLLPDRAESRSRWHLASGPFVVALAGRIEPYKGAPDLLHALADLDLDRPCIAIVAGQCRDSGLRAHLRATAAAVEAPDREIRLCLDELSEHDLITLLRGADVVALPFRAISTSGSLLTSMGVGAACLAPRLPAFAEIPGDAWLSYDPADPSGLAAALRRAAALNGTELDGYRRAARRYTAGLDWGRAAGSHDAVLTVVGS